ncbi:transcriptional regulator, partial [Fulvivirga sp. RKSG066]|uniref:GbsR/MarR family transcriptional regulator n=1 Tax=Fulvivirga aurantia TaxID=2529383 RepID=UPI0012BB4E97
SWGINKTMAQIFALLLITRGELSVEEIMEELSISRGNASMNIRALMDWQLILKTTKKGERKEYFYCERDVWALARKVAEERKNKEIKPVMRVLNQVSELDDENSEDAKEFKRVAKELTDIVQITDKALSHFINSERSWVSKTILKIAKGNKSVS